MVYLGTPKGGTTTDTGCLISYLEIRGKRTTVRVGGLSIKLNKLTPTGGKAVRTPDPLSRGMSFKEIYITMSKKNYSRSKLEGWKPNEGTEHLYEELWFYGKSFWYRKGTEKHKQAKIKYEKYQNTRGNNYSTKGKNNYKSGKTYFT